MCTISSPPWGAGLSVDTRVNPAFPRNAVYASAAWEALKPESGSTINRYILDGQAYAGFIGSSVLALRARSETVDRPLPVYERGLLGGSGSLRGFKAGAFTGDNVATASVELRVPFHSPLHLGQTGVTVFGDAGTAYEHGVTLSDARVEYGAGGGWYLRVPLVPAPGRRRLRLRQRHARARDGRPEILRTGAGRGVG